MCCPRARRTGRRTGVLAGLPIALPARIVVHTLAGDFTAADPRSANCSRSARPWASPYSSTAPGTGRLERQGDSG